MKVFIVGATGVIGKYLVPSLLARGDSVVALVRSIERAAGTLPAGVELHEGDLLTEPPDRLKEMLAGCGAAAHMATALRPGSPGFGTTNTNEALRIEGTRRLLDAALAAGLSRYVTQSIAFAYVDRGDEWIDEATPLAQPDSARAMSRPIVEMEAMVRASDTARASWCILRGGSFVGPGTRQDETVERLRAGSLKVPGDGSNWVSFVQVADYAAAVDIAIRSPVTGIFNVNADPIRNGDYLDRLADAVGATRPARDPDAPLSRSFRCSNAAARAALGWSPSRSLFPERGPA